MPCRNIRCEHRSYERLALFRLPCRTLLWVRKPDKCKSMSSLSIGRLLSRSLPSVDALSCRNDSILSTWEV
jgi:hypothetical protein